MDKMTRPVTKLISVKVTHTAQIADVNRGIRPSSAVTSLNLLCSASDTNAHRKTVRFVRNPTGPSCNRNSTELC